MGASRITWVVALSILSVIAIYSIRSRDTHRAAITTSRTAGQITQSSTSTSPSAVSANSYSDDGYGFAFTVPVGTTWNPGSSVQYPVPSFAAPLVYDVSATSFVSKSGTVPIGALSIPAAIFPNTSFDGGLIGVAVNTAVNESLCSTVPYSRAAPELVIQNVVYSSGIVPLGGGGGRSEGAYVAHVFQNNLCYEFSLLSAQSSVLPHSSTWSASSTLESFLNGVTFFSPRYSL